MSNEFHTFRGYQLLEQRKRHLTSAMEDYLEMIYRYSLEEGYLRIGALAELLNVSAPSASRMARRLCELGLLDFKKYGIILLNETGKEIGQYLLERHQVLEELLRLLGCEEDILKQTELIEHAVSPSLLANIQIICDFFKDYPDTLNLYQQYRFQHDVL